MQPVCLRLEFHNHTDQDDPDCQDDQDDQKDPQLILIFILKTHIISLAPKAD